MRFARELAMTMAVIGAVMTSTSALAQTAGCSAPDVQSAENCSADGRALCTTLDSDTWVVIGGEYRVRSELLDRVNFGIAEGPRSESIAHRGLISADLRRSGGARAFVQLSATDQTGRRPIARPFDESAPDIAQAFIDIPATIEGASLALRVGRQEFGIGNRLVALRDGVTLRRAFDGARLDATIGGHRVTGFYLSPVANSDGAFDDRRTRGEQFAGLNWQFPGTIANGQWTAFVFNRRRSAARFQSAAGAEERQTFGIKYQRTAHGFDITAQGGVQTGRIGIRDILAWGGAVDFGWTLGNRNPLRLGGEIGVASGDGDPSDGRLGTFDPLYPNLGAFNDAPLYFYANQINVQANASKVVGRVTFRADMTLLARASTRDAIYAANGRPLALPADGGQLSAAEIAASARWRVNRHLEFYASYLHAQALDGIRAAGGRSTNFALIQMTAGF
jgi:hypothetical protein